VNQMAGQVSQTRSKTTAGNENFLLLPLIELRLLHAASRQSKSQDSLALALAIHSYQLRFSELRRVLSDLARKGWISRSRSRDVTVYQTTVAGRKALREGEKHLAILAGVLKKRY
jgi:hypothetical protein